MTKARWEPYKKPLGTDQLNAAAALQIEKTGTAVLRLLHLKVPSQRRVPLESLLSSSTVILMRGRITATLHLN